MVQGKPFMTIKSPVLVMMHKTMRKKLKTDIYRYRSTSEYNYVLK